MMRVDNREAHYTMGWILEHASSGFFIVIASSHMQRKIADFYQTDNMALYDYAHHSKPYSYPELNDWAGSHPDKDVFFILNMHLAFQDEKGIISEENMLMFNMSRDLLASKQKNWIFFMTEEADTRLSTFAYDIYSFMRQRIHFQDEEERVLKVGQVLEFDEVHNVKQIKEMLGRYKDLEERYLALPLDTTDEKLLLSSAISLENIANLYEKCADYINAFEMLTRVWIIREKVLGKGHPATATTYTNMALVYLRQGDYIKALEWYHKALDVHEKVLGREHLATATTYNNIGLVYSRQGDYVKALEWYHKALDVREKFLSREHPDTATTYNNMGLVYSRQGDYTEALKWYQKALDVREKVLSKEHLATATTYNNMAGIYSRQGEYTKALEWYQETLDISEKILGGEHPAIAMTYNNIGLVYLRQGDYAKALEWYHKALDISEKVLGKEHPQTITIQNNIVTAKSNTKQKITSN